jgi:D-alanyl-lipoteichoic acid acyltransferase DltB (MBOAT superfamily)
MLFNSLEFLVFFPIVIMLYYALPFKYRWLMLLVASYVFYMWWKAEYALLILASTLIDYFAARWLEKTTHQIKRKCLLALSLASNLGILFFFKYFNFVNTNLGSLSEIFGFAYQPSPLDVLLPVGISFYTFQTMSYTIDVFKGNMKAEKHFGYFALYVTYFPQLVAGPIERAERLLPQMHENHSLSAQNISRGLKLIFWGMFKKVAVADNLAPYVNEVFNHPQQYEGLSLLLATVFFSFQIYYDFSGYSDIAIGSARVMGVHLMTNFNHPYFATSVAEFWRRWHISLSTWFRDYVYIPLGGNRSNRYRNILITFLLSGLWHGANWTFIVWGGLHGLYMVIADKTKSFQHQLIAGKVFHVAITYLLILFAWIFFRANSIQDAFLVIQKLPNISLQFSALNVLKDAFGLSLMLALLITMQLIHFYERRENIMLQLERKPVALRWSFYSALLWLLFLYGNYSEQEFIYFTF